MNYVMVSRSKGVVAFWCYELLRAGWSRKNPAYYYTRWVLSQTALSQIHAQFQERIHVDLHWTFYGGNSFGINFLSSLFSHMQQELAMVRKVKKYACSEVTDRMKPLVAFFSCKRIYVRCETTAVQEFNQRYVHQNRVGIQIYQLKARKKNS